MKKFLLSMMAMCFAFICTTPVSAAITKEYGWFESAAIEWEAVSGATDYNVYVKAAGGAYTKLDNELVRKYPAYFRADALGLTAGTYQMKVVGVDSNGNEIAGSEMESGNMTVRAHDRSGFAHVGMSGGIGAYKNDGTLKDGAKVLYVWADNAKTVTTNVVTNNKGGTTTGVGLQDIVYLYQKGYETTPIAIRIIGTIKDSDMDRFDSSAEGLQVKGKGAYADMPITIEGVGEDAAIWGFGILCRNASDVEFRNFAIMLCMDDCLSLDTSNSNIWIHNMDFFYGNTGGDSDQAKGDGTCDIKGKSKNITVSYNHFIDCGKTSLGGMKSETTDCWMTYHHNWYDHSDSRHPRIRTAFYHCYNNYFDGVSKYGVGVTMGGSAFVENNYFRNCKYPMLSSKQGTDAEGDGTFSGENSGVIKAYNNYIQGEKKIQYWSSDVQSTGAWDAVQASSRDASVSATAFVGGTSYNSTADAAARSAVAAANIDAPENVKDIVKGSYGAGRMNHGDFEWKFNNSIQDANYGVISELKSALQSYKSTLVGFADGTSISNGGATSTVKGGDGQGISDAVNDAVEPSWGSSGGGSTTISAGKYVIGSKEDYFWFNTANTEAYNDYTTAGNFTTDGTFKPEQILAKSDGTSCSDYIGSIRLAQNQSFTAYYSDGIVSANFYVSGTGTQNWKLEKSADGTTWTSVGEVTGKAAAHPSCVITASNDEGIKYVRITNTNSSNRDLQGIKIATYDPDANPDEDPADEPEDTRSSDATAEFTLNAEDITFSGTTYTLNVAWDAEDEAGYTIAITPAENATIAAVTGATASGDNYIIDAPAAGETATATFRILAENQANTKTYTINIVKGVDPSTIPLTTGEFLYFPGGSKTYNSFYSVNGSTTNSKGSGTYVRNGETYNCDYTLKLETKTTITFTPTQDGILKIGYSGSGASNSKLNGDKITETEVNVTAGTAYTLTKADVAYLLYLDLVYGGSADTREASAFELTSDDTPNIEVGATTAITYQNNAGAVTFESDNEAVATVSSEGVVTGVKDGVAKITVTDPGSETIKDKSYTVTVTVGTGEQGGSQGGSQGGDEPVVGGDVVLEYGNIPAGYAVDGSTTVTFYDFENKWTSQNLFTVTKNDEHTITIPNGVTVTKIVLYGIATDNNPATLESLAGTSQNVSLPNRKADAVGTVTVDNVSITGSFTFKITGKNAAVKFALTTASSTPTGIFNFNTVEQAEQGIIYDLMGRRIFVPQQGQLYIKNGKKFIGK